MSKLLNLRSSKNTLLQVDGEALEAAKVEDTADVGCLQGTLESGNNPSEGQV